MRFSKFNLYVADAPAKGETAVFNTLTRGMAVLKSSELEGARRGSACGLVPEEIKSLEDAGVLVPEGMDEDLFFNVYYNQVRFDNTSLRLSILTTLNCNFACPYCYEGDLTYGKKKMTAKTAEHVAEWIKKRAVEGRVSKIRIEYMGGEPLLNIAVIEKIGPELMKFCDAKGIEFVSVMISNGYLLTKETTERIKAAGVESVRVTIDGPEEIHNSTRFLRGGGGKTYRTIINNLVDSKDIMSLSICGTFARETARHIPGLLDELEEAGLGPDVLNKVQLAPMMPSETGGKAAGFDKRCIPANDFHEVFNIGNNELTKRGYGNYAEPEFSPCPAISSGDFTINWDGSLYKCPCLVDHSGYEVGHVKEDLLYNAELVRCLGHSTIDNEICRNCNILPLCLGGCRYMALVENGNFHSLDCKKKEIEAVAVETVRRMASEGS